MFRPILARVLCSVVCIICSFPMLGAPVVPLRSTIFFWGNGVIDDPDYNFSVSTVKGNGVNSDYNMVFHLVTTDPILQVKVDFLPMLPSSSTAVDDSGAFTIYAYGDRNAVQGETPTIFQQFDMVSNNLNIDGMISSHSYPKEGTDLWYHDLLVLAEVSNDGDPFTTAIEMTYRSNTGNGVPYEQTRWFMRILETQGPLGIARDGLSYQMIVPEPSSLMFLCGSGLLLLRRSKRS